MNRKLFFDYNVTLSLAKISIILLFINLFFFQENLVWYFFIIFSIWWNVLYNDIGIKMDDFFYVKKYFISKTLILSVGTGGIFTLMHREYVYSSSDSTLIVFASGLISFAFGVFFLIRKDLYMIRKSPKDFPNLKQEKIYDNIDLDLAEAFENERIIKKDKYKTITKKYLFGLINKEKKVYDGEKKIVDYSYMDLDVVDDKHKKLLRNVKREIVDIINEENLDFYDYSLTKFANEEEAKEFVDKLELKDKDLKNKYDGYSFLRFWYQMIQENLKNLSSEDSLVEYDLMEGIKKFDGIFEYAFLDMYLYQDEFINRPLGNSKSLAKKDCDVNGNRNMLHMYGAMNSAISTSISKVGIAYYAGYYLTLKNKGIKSNRED